MMKSLRKFGVHTLFVFALLRLSSVVQAQTQTITTVKQAAKAAKVTTDLYGLMQNQGRAQAAPVAVDGFIADKKLVIIGDKVAIEAVANNQDGAGLLQQLNGLGLTEGVSHKGLVFGYLPIDKLGDLKNIPSLSFARPHRKPVTNSGSVTSQGDAALKADVARSTYGVTGAGVKVGVLSDSYNAFLKGAALGIASGDLPAAGVQVISDYYADDATDEGRAMIEIVHDVAPGAAIAFSTAFRGQATFARNIIELAKAGCQIIVDDVYNIYAPFFQDGIVAQAINDVVTNYGVTYFSSAGNSARSSYQAPYKSGGTFVNESVYGTSTPFPTHNFSASTIDNLQRIAIPGGSYLDLVLQWDNPFQSVSGGVGATTDLDIFVLSTRTGAVISRGDDDQSDGGDPVEFVSVYNPSSSEGYVDVVIVKRAGPDPGLVKWVNFGSWRVVPEYETKTGALCGHANSAQCISVGAAAWHDSPVFNGAATATIEPFSSAGGTPILFTTTGERINGIVGETRQKPNITAVDGVNTTFFYADTDRDDDTFPNFSGTSAAAPHAAAVAALIKEKVPNISRNTILATLQSTALDMDDPATEGFDTGFDYGTGYGFIQADRALQAISGGSNTAPVATTNANQTATVGLDFTYTVNAFTDDTPNSLTYSASIAPANGLSFDPATRIISGTPSLRGVSTVTITATDPGSLSASTTFTVTVNPTPTEVTPLVLSASANPTVILTTGTATLSATVSGGTPPYSYTFQGPGTITPSGNTAIVSGLSAGEQTFTVVAQDATTPTSQTISTTVSVTVTAPSPVNTAPVATANTNQTATVGVNFTYTVNAFTDAETPDSLIYAANIEPTNGLSFDPATRIISGTPSLTGVSTVAITATDPGSLSASTTFTITVSPTSLTPEPTVPFAITGVTTVTCEVLTGNERRVTFTPQYSGLTGQPITFSVLNEIIPTTAAGPYSLRLYTDNPRVKLVAQQSGTAGEASFTYEWLASCETSTTPNPTNFAITGVTTLNCERIDEDERRVSFMPQYSGLTGQPITFSVVNEIMPTTSMGPYSLRLYTDNPVITLRAQQAGTVGEVIFSYNWLAGCGNLLSENTAPTVANPIPNQFATVGQAFSYTIPTNTFADSQTESALLTLSASGLPVGLSLSGTTGTPTIITGIPSVSGVSTVTITATDPGGLAVSTTFTLTVNPDSVTLPSGFAITGVSLVSCETEGDRKKLTFTPLYSGLDGQPITFRVINETQSTTNPGPSYSLALYADNPVINLEAVQSGAVATFSYNWLANCGSARIGVERTPTLQVRVLGNPVQNVIDVEVSKQNGAALTWSLMDMHGHMVTQRQTQQAGDTERHQVDVRNQPAGVLLLRVSTQTHSQTIRILKVN